MRERLERRLGELEAEYETGQRMLAELEAQQAELRETLLRVSGAIQVLQELLSAEPQAGPEPEPADGRDGLVDSSSSARAARSA